MCFLCGCKFNRSRNAKPRITDDNINMVCLGRYLANCLAHRRLVRNIAMDMGNSVMTHTMPAKFKYAPSMLCK